MSFSKKLFVAVAILFASACFMQAQNCFAFGMHRIDHESPWGDKITPEQREVVQKILEQNWNATSNTRQELSGKYKELDSQLRSENPDLSRIESLSREIGELRGKLLESRVKVRSELTKLGLPSDYYAFHDMQGHNEIWHRGERGFNHRMGGGWYNQGRYSCWRNN